MNATLQLVRLALRRDRLLLPAWILTFVVMAAGSAAATVPLFPTESSRILAANGMNAMPSLVALYGKIYDPTSVGALAIIKMGGLGAALVAVFAIVVMVRHTRADEQAGRLELVGATPVGRHAPLAAAVLVALGANVVLAVLTASGLIAAGLPVEGSIVFGLAWASVGLAFSGIAAVVSQLTRSARAAVGLSSMVLGVVYVLRAIADAAQPEWLTWLSPIGWGQQFRPYAGNRWWVLLITVGFAAAAAALAHALAVRRDLGAGLLADREGPATAAPSLRSPLALAWRLQRGPLLAWAASFLLLGLVFGNISSTVGEFFDAQGARELITALGGTSRLTDAFLSFELSMTGVIASVYGVQAAMRLRGEENELLLAAPVGRARYALSHLTIAVLGCALLMALMGLGAGIAHGAQIGDPGQTWRLLGAALVQLPAAWVLVGITTVVFGAAPRVLAGVWAVLLAFVLLGELGPLLKLDPWVMDLSPFAHTPKLPGAAMEVAPPVVLTGIALMAVLAGVTAFRRRDLG
ncbi:ABC transporter permease [Nonomuraea soli]|uniref:ABC-2 type transport system permease protein n=1 Tax=Nonomuraea soli TaxID=1032476 RepID=A0A7W0HNP5_9ACTN|nr:ABC transporter permease [Nonomuraea soli]MBA2890018.1 ABC-2 type transport system permease protein [Nonomuraea soli]